MAHGIALHHSRIVHSSSSVMSHFIPMILIHCFAPHIKCLCLCTTSSLFGILIALQFHPFDSRNRINSLCSGRPQTLTGMIKCAHCTLHNLAQLHTALALSHTHTHMNVSNVVCSARRNSRQRECRWPANKPSMHISISVSLLRHVWRFLYSFARAVRLI